jgi:hypothetical protein
MTTSYKLQAWNNSASIATFIYLKRGLVNFDWLVIIWLGFLQWTRHKIQHVYIRNSESMSLVKKMYGPYVKKTIWIYI